MAGVNKVILIGNLGRDPQLDYTPSGVARCRFSLATTERYVDKDGQQQERTEWHNIVLWGRLAEIAGEYLKKGRQVYIEGSIRTRQYEDQNGQTRYITEIVAQNMQMLGRAAERGYEEVPPPEEPEEMGVSPRRTGAQPPREEEPAEEFPEEEMGEEDDLPF